ncbi:hypothetical protein JCM5350_003710 [Sporobolomyces pararoseus]
MQKLPSLNTTYSSVEALQFDMTQRGVSDLLSCDMARYGISREGGFQDFMHYRCRSITPNQRRCTYGLDAVQLPDGRFRISRTAVRHNCSIEERIRTLEQHRARAQARIERLNEQINHLEREKEAQRERRAVEEAERERRQRDDSERARRVAEATETLRRESMAMGELSIITAERKRKRSDLEGSNSALPDSLTLARPPVEPSALPEPSTLPPQVTSSREVPPSAVESPSTTSTSTERPDLETLVRSSTDSPAQAERVLANFESAGIENSDRLLACLVSDKAHFQMILSKLRSDTETSRVIDKMEGDLKGTVRRSKRLQK